jgi:hypothetical protein
MAKVNLHTTRAIVWTVILALFVAFEVYSRYAWLPLVIPGTVLMWYGLLAELPDKNAVRNRTRSDLN